MDTPVYERPLKKFRCLFSNGQIFDCLAHQDDSDFRGWILQQNGYEKKNSEVNIAAVVELKDNET